MGYQKNTWTIYNENIPNEEQPHSFITKRKLDNIEKGIENAVTDFKIGTVSKGVDVDCEIVQDENDPSIKRINITIPKQVSWIFSDYELKHNDLAPSGMYQNDIILDIKGNIFTVEIINGYARLIKKINIRGEDGKDYHLEMGDISVGYYPSAEITSDHKLNIVLPEPCKSVYDIWLELGNEGTPEDFINSLKGESINIPILNTLDEVINNESENALVASSVVKELYNEIQKISNLLKS